MKRKVLVLKLVLALGLFPAIAQESFKDTLKLEEVVVTGSKTPQSVGNVTQKIDIIDSKEIGSLVFGNRNVSEALMYKPGASVSVLSRNDANWGTYGGIGPKYSTYMLQGLPIDAFVDPMALDLNAIERIEVQRGPASVLYPNYLSQDFAGNQSPLAGTVNLILKERIEKASTKVSTSYGSYNTINGQAYHENKIGSLSFFAGTSYEKSDYTNYGSENSWLNIQDDPEYTKTKIYGGLNYLIGNSQRQKLSLFYNHTNHTGDAGRLYRGINHNYDMINAGYSLSISENLYFQVNVGLRTYNRCAQESNFGVIDTLVSTNGNDQTILPADISLSYKHGEGNLVVGVDYQSADYSTWSDALVGYRTFGTKAKALQRGVYAQEEYKIGAIIARAGIKYSFIKNEIDLLNGTLPGQKEQDWNILIWSAGLKYNITPTTDVFVNAGNSFMTPGLKAIGGTIKLSDEGVIGKNGQLPNPDLKPESGIGFDGGFNIHIMNGLKTSIRGFYLNVSDAVVDKRVYETPSQSRSVNAGEASSVGAEFEILYRLNNNLSCYANATYFKTEIKSDINPDQDGANIPFAPEIVANMGLQLNTNFGFHLMPNMNYNGGYYDSDSKTSRKKFTPGAIINIFASQDLKKNDIYKLELFGQFYNITNNKYEMPWQFRDPGFSMMAGIRATF
ncbi:MAG: TonB-dependent receptor [Bacteroidales bacterium]|nr:TonB-dependent receptor [Bacteroidales bacterium]HOK99776.1 TonB-dependent receptor [Bacteroidales bacterium]HPO66546.1 TonB-dependent receptor [Bacteroidales bacterium]